jgi:hypothetical protein
MRFSQIGPRMARVAVGLLAVFLISCWAVAFEFRDRGTPVCRLQASYHLSMATSHYGCGPGPAPALSVSERASVNYHMAMHWLFSSVAELKKEPRIELAKLRSYRL